MAAREPEEDRGEQQVRFEQQDRIVRTTARVAALRKRLQSVPQWERVPRDFVDDFNEAIRGVEVPGGPLTTFEFKLPASPEQDADRILFLARLDAVVDYLSLPQHMTALEFPDDSLLDSKLDVDEPEPSVFTRAYRAFDGLFFDQPSRRAADGKRSWNEIAREVRNRKSLLLAATQQLRNRRIPHDFRLATVDVFVEKAQKQLSDRANSYRLWGTVTALAALGLIGFAIGYIPKHSLTSLLGIEPVWSEKPGLDQTNPWHMGLVLLRTSTLAGLYAGAVMYLIFLSRALLHEMVVLYQRRHALRFGRLFIYLHPEKISVDELLNAFNWNVEYRSAFKDIRADKIMQGVPGKLMDTSVELATKSVEAMKHYKEVVQPNPPKAGN